MRNLRAALLVLLVYLLAGPGVPAGLAQSKSSAKKQKTPPAASSAKAARKPAVSRPAGKKPSRRSRRRPGQTAPTSERISEIQAALAKDGSFQGAPSGKWDDDTAGAMRRFQAAHGLNPTGKLDARSLQKLGLGSETAGAAPPTPPPGATSRLTSSSSAPPAAEAARRQ
jgi:peptidoglycan hydrolase-like protein with peptidoglycan-binding domain